MTDCRECERRNSAEFGDRLANTVRWKEKEMSKKASFMSCK